MAGPTAMKARPAASGQPQVICVAPSDHSTPAKAPDQPSPKIICAMRKAAQSPRSSRGSLVRTSSQL